MAELPGAAPKPTELLHAGAPRRFPTPHSLRARLTLSLLAAVVATALIQGGVTWRTASVETEALFDAQMEHTALSLSGGMIAGAIGEEPTTRALRAPEQIVQIWRSDGVMLYRSPTRMLLPPQSVIGFSRVTIGGSPYRVYTLPTPTQVIQVAQDAGARRRAVGRLALRAILPIALLAPVLMLIVWWVIGRALAPVKRLRAVVATRAAGDLAPLPVKGLPAEILPLVAEMNGLLGRLARAWRALDDFTADAAHELRSPLAALRLQVQSLQRAPDAQARRIAIHRLVGGVDRATRLVEQLLLLARQEGAPGEPQGARADLAAVARQAIAMAAADSGSRHPLLELVGDARADVPGDPAALALLLRNLLDNALRYAPAGGVVRVDVRAASASAGALLVVEDSGPGIAPADRARVWDRFYRAPEAAGPGSGLGLAIVRAIARQLGADVALGTSTDLGGAAFSVRWPAQERARASGLRPNAASRRL